MCGRDDWHRAGDGTGGSRDPGHCCTSPCCHLLIRSSVITGRCRPGTLPRVGTMSWDLAISVGQHRAWRVRGWWSWWSCWWYFWCSTSTLAMRWNIESLPQLYSPVVTKRLYAFKSKSNNSRLRGHFMLYIALFDTWDVFFIHCKLHLKLFCCAAKWKRSETCRTRHENNW